MAVIAFTMANPHNGKQLATESRARTLGGIYARHGASVKISRVVAGPNTGCVTLLRAYADFRAAARAFQAISNDPAHAEFWRERESNPAADIVIARDIFRTVHGEPQWTTHPLAHNRQYDLPKNKVVEALELMPEVEKLMSGADVNVVCVVPITGNNLSSMTLSYQFRSMEHWGEALDTVGTSDEFQALIARAAEFGTLRSASAMVAI